MSENALTAPATRHPRYCTKKEAVLSMPSSVYVKKKRAKPYIVVNTIAMIGAKNTDGDLCNHLRPRPAIVDSLYLLSTLLEEA